MHWLTYQNQVFIKAVECLLINFRVLFKDTERTNTSTELWINEQPTLAYHMSEWKTCCPRDATPEMTSCHLEAVTLHTSQSFGLIKKDKLCLYREIRLIVSLQNARDFSHIHGVNSMCVRVCVFTWLLFIHFSSLSWVVYFGTCVMPGAWPPPCDLAARRAMMTQVFGRAAWPYWQAPLMLFVQAAVWTHPCAPQR